MASSPSNPYAGQQQGGPPAGYGPGGPGGGAPPVPVAPPTAPSPGSWLVDPTHTDDGDKYKPSPAAASVAGSDPTNWNSINHAYDVTGREAGFTQTARDAYDRQTQLADLLQAGASGQGPSGAGMAGAAQRDANLTQAAALLSGRRGQGAGVGVRAAGNQAVAGNQLAAQTEAMGRVNEMQGARGQLAGVLGQQANENVSQAQLDQQVRLANSGQAQQAMLASQASQLGISEAEMQQRARQEQMAYGNLNPGGGGGGIGQYFAPVLGAAGAVIGGIYGGPGGAMAGYSVGNAVGSGLSHAAHGKYVRGPTVALIGEAGPEVVVPLTPGNEHRGMQVSALHSIVRALHEGRLDRGDADGAPHMADGGYVGAQVPVPQLGQPQVPQMPYGYGYQPPVQLMGIGQRVVPNFNVNRNIQNARINASIQALVNSYVAHLYGKQAAADKAAKASKADADSLPLSQRFPHGGGTGEGPVTDPSQLDGAIAAAPAQGSYWTADLPGVLGDAASDVPAMADGGYVGRPTGNPYAAIAYANRNRGGRAY